MAASGGASYFSVMGAAVTGLATDAVFVIDANTRGLLQANRAFSRMFGYAAEEVPSLSLFDIAANEKGDMQANLAKLEREGEIDLGVRPFRRKDGATLEMEVKAGQMVVDGRRLFCVIARDLSERRRTERALLESEERFRKLAEAAFEGIAITEGGLFRDASPRMAELLGAPLAKLLGRPVSDFVAAESMDKVALHMRSGSEQPYEHLARRADGSVFPVEVQAKAITFGGRSMRVTAIRDISSRKKLEEQLRLAQRMESVGRLAGGVAHDFNNLLTVILSATELVKASPRLNDADLEEIAHIDGAGKRAAELTRQLLAFARQHVVEARTIDLNVLTANVGKMLRRLIGEDIELVTRAGDHLGAIRADPAQVEQVLMNLAVNARDAMPGGGRLSVETANVTVDEAHAISHPEVQAGQYVMIRFIDTGVGMDSATLAHIFEPFFTTKPAGTGLGLATCYGIVRQAGGFISVSSEPGSGTTFEVYFPHEHGGLSAATPHDAPGVSTKGHETVLVVEDEPLVRRMALRILRGLGYVVVEAADSAEAARRLDDLGGRIDLLVTDVIMPGGSGRELAELLRRGKPDLKVLFTSGYSENTTSPNGVVDAAIHFLPKPYGPTELATAVREVLDEQ